MFEILAFAFLGILAGVITGLLPGLHPNTVIFLSIPFYLSLQLDFFLYGSFVAGLSVSHTFHDFIPSIFLGVPDPSSALSALPGQKMARKGLGKEAFAYTVYGGLYASIALLPVAFILYYSIGRLYSALQPFMAYILLFIVLLVVFKSETERKAFVVAALSGVLGLLAFESPANQQYVLLPVFGGLFAVPSLVQGMSYRDSLPDQLSSEVGKKHSAGGSLAGVLASIPIVIFPGLSTSISTTFLMPLMKSRRQFLAATGAANTSDIILSFVTLLAMESARSGASVAIQSLGKPETIWLLLAVSAISVGISAPISFLSIEAVLASELLKYQKAVSACVIVFLVAISLYLTSYMGLLILFTASAIGFMASLSSDRHSCMAVLIVPSITYFAPPGMFM